MPHDLDAFVAHAGLGSIDLQTSATGPLAGLTFAVKDFFDIAGVPTGAGSPDWLSSHEVPALTASVVVRALDAGARLVGKTQTDELAWSLNGENHHYGTPINPAAPGRIPGGSSSGSAASTAGGLVDFAIGSDTGGSVRLPASYCGLYGMRTTHGRIPVDGAVPLAPSYDTVGWFARDASLFRRVGRVLLGSAPEPLPAFRHVLIAEDMFGAMGEDVRGALWPAVEHVCARFGEPETVDLAGPARARWRDVFRILQSSEAWRQHADWVARVKPTFGPGIRERFAAAARLSEEEIAAAKADRVAITVRMRGLVGEGTVIVLPSGPGAAPLRGLPEADLDAFRARALEMLCPAGHAGLPQISLPLGRIEGLPIGLSVIGPAGSDERLMELAESLEHPAMPT